MKSRNPGFSMFLTSIPTYHGKPELGDCKWDITDDGDVRFPTERGVSGLDRG